MTKTLSFLAVIALSFSIWSALNNKVSSSTSVVEVSAAAPDTQTASSVVADDQSAMTQKPAQTANTESNQDAIHYQTPMQSDQLELLPVLEGTGIDGFLAATEAGELVISLQTRDFFDYFLSQANLLEDPWQSIEQIHLLAEQHLPAQAAEEAKQLLDAYLGYQELAYQYLSQPLAPAQEQTPEYKIHVLEAAQQELMRLRRQVFEPPVVDAFFGMEEAYTDFALTRLTLMHDPYLEPQEKEAALQKAAAKLPAELRNSEARHREQLQALVE
ncbi:lipase chaperone protein [Marinospirillum celere]|uniref:Lipase chaperone n=1 Tax=Marinospirillum celere TaxID=1122252 RepID=A0A1I1IKD8_9GAMM|nr:lipase secretion chaperone [Marinospirillum celere]SFC33690.1 lipase chaperone protein [Marinospirillum celere]